MLKEIRRIARYDIQGTILRECRICGNITDCNVLIDKLTNEVILVCNDCFADSDFKVKR